MKDEGYIPLSRRLFDHPFWKQKRVFSRAEAWIDLIRIARYEYGPVDIFINGKLIIIDRGEAPISLRFLASEWGWSKNKVDSFIKILLNESMIKIRTADGTQQTVVTICKYDDYNLISKNEGQQKGQEKDTERTPKGHRKDNTNKDNKVNNNIIPPTPPLGDSQKKDSINAKARELFEKKYFDKFQSYYYWSAKDAGGMTKLISKIRYARKMKKMETSDSMILYALGFMLDSIDDGWMCENYSVSNINSKYNEIVSKVKSKEKKDEKRTVYD